MLDPAYVRDHQDDVKRGLQNRGLQVEGELEQLAILENRRRRLIPELEGLKRDQNASGDEVARAKRQGKDASAIFEANRQRAQQIRQISIELDQVEQQRTNLLMSFPNLPHASVPVGKSEADNVVVRTWGEPTKFDFEPQAHWDLGPALGILDFERATKMSGARFAVLMGAGARLSRALTDFMLDLHTREHGYVEVVPPYLVNRASLEATGQLPKFEADLFKIAGEWDLFLIPTAEVPLTNLHRNEILNGDLLPLKYTAYTPCFRSEAGSYGKDVRGLIRQHQFEKVEMVKIVHPDTSYDELESMTLNAEDVLQRLGLPYRTIVLVYRRRRFFHGQDLRRRGVAARPERVQGNLLVLECRRVPGAAGQHQVQGWRNGKGGVRPHVERVWPADRPNAGGGVGELPAEGWIRRRARGAAPVHGRVGTDCAPLGRVLSHGRWQMAKRGFCHLPCAMCHLP